MTTLLVLCIGLGATAWADTLVNWIGPTGMGGYGNWSTASDWSGGVVPNNGNGITYSVSLPTYSTFSGVNLDMSPTINNLTIDPMSELFVGAGKEILTTQWLENSGSITVTNSGTIFAINGAVRNLGGFGLELSAGLNVQGDFFNEGTFTSSPEGRESLDVTGNFNNSGQFQLGQVATSITGAFRNNDGSVFAYDLPLTAASYVQTGGSTVLNGSTMKATDITVNGGVFTAVFGSALDGDVQVPSGTLSFRASVVNGNIYIGAATLSNLSSLGIGEVNGNLTTTGASLYEQQMGSGPDAVQLAISGDASLNGTLDLIFDEAKDGTYQIMTYSAVTSQFNTVDAFGLSSYQNVALEYGPTALDVVVAGTPEPTSLLLMSTGLLAVAYHCRRRFTAK